MKKHGCFSAILTVLLLCLCGCTVDSEVDPEIEMERMVFDVDAVAKAAYPQACPGFSLKSGRLSGGTAVMSEGATFWVKDGQVYAVNEQAKTIAAHLEPAPAGITPEAVKRAAEDGTIGRTGPITVNILGIQWEVE